MYQDKHYAEMLEVSRRAARLAEEANAPEDLDRSRVSAEPSAHWASQRKLARVFSLLSPPSNRASSGRRKREQQPRRQTRLGSTFDLLVLQRQYAEALTFAERSKARVLLDMLQAGRTNIRKSLSPEERRTEEEQRLRLVGLNSLLTGELRRDQPDQARVTELKAGIAKARLEYEALETNLYVAHPELRVHRGEASIIKAEELRTLLPDSKSVLLEYVPRIDLPFRV